MKALFLALMGALTCAVLTGCASHAARLEIETPPDDIREAFHRVKTDIAVVLRARGFTQDSPAQLRDDLRSRHPDAVTWSKTIRVGGRNDARIGVWIWRSRRSIDIILDAKDDGTGEEVKATLSVLATRLREQFPSMETKVSSWEYLNLK